MREDSLGSDVILISTEKKAVFNIDYSRVNLNKTTHDVYKTKVRWSNMMRVV